MITSSNIQPFCLLNGKMGDQLFDYTEDELTAFHKAIQPDMLPEVFDAVEDEYRIQSSPSGIESATRVADYVNSLSSDELEKFSKYLMGSVYSDVDKLKTDSLSYIEDVEDDIYNSPRVELLEGYIAISSSNLQALDKFKDRVIKTSDITWEHRIKKHGDVTIHSYVFNIKEDSN